MSKLAKLLFSETHIQVTHSRPSKSFKRCKTRAPSLTIQRQNLELFPKSVAMVKYVRHIAQVHIEIHLNILKV